MRCTCEPNCCRKIAELGLGKNTLIVVTSDSGEPSGFSQLDPLLETKGPLFEAGVLGGFGHCLGADSECIPDCSA